METGVWDDWGTYTPRSKVRSGIESGTSRVVIK